MGNPFLNGFRPNSNSAPANPTQFVQLVRQIQNDPSQLPKLLLNNNRINQHQYEALNQMNGNYAQMVQYLIQQGVMNMGK